MEHIAAAFSNASDTDATDTSRLARTLLQTALTFLNSGSPVQYYVPVNRAMPLIAQFASMIDARIAAEQYDPIATFAEAESMVAKSMVAKPIVPAVG